VSSLVFAPPVLAAYAENVSSASAKGVLACGAVGSLSRLLLCSVLLSAVTLPLARRHVHVSDPMYVALLAVHLFSFSAAPLLYGLLAPTLSSPLALALVAAGAGSLALGAVSEMTAHFFDGWWFSSHAKAFKGVLNAAFNIGLLGGLSLLAAACYPSAGSALAAGAAPVGVAWLFQAGLWQRKVIRYGTQTGISLATSLVYIAHFKSLWPLLYFSTAFMIVHNAKTCVETELQQLHLLPSLYSWGGIVLSFALAAKPETRASGALLVGIACASSVLLSVLLHLALVRLLGRSRVHGRVRSP